MLYILYQKVVVDNKSTKELYTMSKVSFGGVTTQSIDGSIF